MPVKSLIFSLCILLYASAGHSSNGPLNVMAPNEVFRFASELQESRDYLMAATEFKRYISFAKAHPKHSYQHLEASHFSYALCLEKLGDTHMALQAYSDFGAKFPKSTKIAEGLYRIATIYEKENNFEESAKRYEMLVQMFPASEFADKAKLRLAWISVKDGNIKKAHIHLNDIENSRRLPSQQILSSALDLQQPPDKNPKLAGFLSAVLPGAGHVYLGRKKDATFAFLSNALLIAATVEAFDEDLDILGGILAFTEAGWYTGTIYSSISLTHKYNKRKQDEYYENLAPYFSLGEKNPLHIGLSLEMKF